MKRRHQLIAAGCLAVVAMFGASAAGSSSVLHEVAIECAVKGSNDGCVKTVGCPPGTTLRTARAACNLEHGPVSDEQLSSVQQGYVEVVRLSDHVEEGRCWLGSSQVESGRVAIADLVGRTRVAMGCQEHDRNGGDCEIRGTLYCQ